MTIHICTHKKKMLIQSLFQPNVHQTFPEGKKHKLKATDGSQLRINLFFSFFVSKASLPDQYSCK